jgi:hypothetical protein
MMSLDPVFLTHTRPISIIKVDKMSAKKLYKNACRLQRELNRLQRMKLRIPSSSKRFFENSVIRAKQVELAKSVERLRDYLSSMGHYRGSFLVFSRIKKSCADYPGRDRYDATNISRRWYAKQSRKFKVVGVHPEIERLRIRLKADSQYAKDDIPF